MKITLIVFGFFLCFFSCNSQDKKKDSLAEKVKSVELNNLAMEIIYNNSANKDSLEKAISYLEKSILIDSNYILAYNNLVSTLCMAGRNEQALLVLDKLIKIKPDLSGIKLLKGWLLECSGRYMESSKIYEGIKFSYNQELEKKPDDITLLVNRAFLYLFTNDLHYAKKEVSKIEKKYPDNDEVKNVRDIISSFDRVSFLESICQGNPPPFMVSL